MPYVGHLPADETIGSELSKLFDTITKVKQQRRQRDIEGGLLKALASGGTPEEMQRQISEVMMQQPEPRGGFLGGILDAFNPMTAARMERTSLEDAIMGRMLEGALQTPLETARTKYYEQGGRAKAKPVTPVTGASMERYNKAMDFAIEEVKKGDVGGFDWTKDNLLKAWENFKTSSGYSDMPDNQKKQLWASWNNKIRRLNLKTNKIRRKLGIKTKGEYEWDLNDPDVIAASGLEGLTAPSRAGLVGEFENTAQAQSAPVIQLDGIWPNLSIDQKGKIWQAWQEAEAEGVSADKFGERALELLGK